MSPRYKIDLTPEERSLIEDITKKGKHESRTVLSARALLLCDSSQVEALTSSEISKALGMSERTIDRLKKRFVEEGLDSALSRKPMDMSSRDIKFDGAFEARLIALACSEAPEGSSRWTVRLLAEKAVELNIIDSVSPMTIQRTLKKTNFNLISKNTGKSRPKAVEPS
jgi:DNA-binding CsgD family transcriptional regulator